MFPADWLSALDRRFHLTNRVRPRRRRGNRPLRVAAEVSLLEDRCLMSRSLHAAHPPCAGAYYRPRLGPDRHAGQQRVRAGRCDVSESKCKNDCYL